MRPLAYVMVPVLYVVFAAAAAVAGVVGLLSLLTGSTKPISRICRAMDALLAAQLSIFFPSWDGRATVSNECGRTDCRFCRVLCAVLNLMQKDHCEIAAEEDQ